MTDLFLVCYDVTNYVSYLSLVAKWFLEVMHYGDGAPIILVGLKEDLRGTLDDAQEFTSEVSAAHADLVRQSPVLWVIIFRSCTQLTGKCGVLAHHLVSSKLGFGNVHSQPGNQNPEIFFSDSFFPLGVLELQELILIVLKSRQPAGWPKRKNKGFIANLFGKSVCCPLFFISMANYFTCIH